MHNYQNKIDTLRLLLKRDPDSNKYDYGHVLIIGGSPGMVGAPYLSGRAALRAGTGLVTIASIDHVIDKIENRTEEIMTLALGPDWSHAFGRLATFITNRKVSVVVIGPGLLPNQATRLLIERLLNKATVPIIIDGGALRAGKDSILARHIAASPAIITPHLGEFKYLLDLKPTSATVAELHSTADTFARNHDLTVVLKGHHTYVTDGTDGHDFINPTGNPGLATAGTGDVLTGIIAALIGQNLSVSEAAASGVLLHGLAGDIAVSETTEVALIASDIIKSLPKAFRSLAG